ncbi:MAG: Rpn family recombination-promoting nuclease/putative transposase [Spirochaetales bacterium]|nr:Rpn family recombination-promoting nuclease/putative transposase [Spirochaetales bacterium]MDY5914079.1 Rpn family recombination-promoting nuclease/putative transposase [Treponema sp.]
MAEKDITEKNLEALNDVFADIVNVLLFKGEQVINEKELEVDTTKSMFKADGKIHEQERDVSKFWKNGEIRISILGIENQTAQDSDMPLRVISYDGASYKQQLLDKKQKKRYPVATLVLYFGTEEKWSKAKHLYDCFEVPEKLKPFVNDYKINVFNIAFLSPKTIAMFKSDFKIIAEYFRAKRLNQKYKGSKEKLKHANETLKMFSALTGDDSFEKVYNEGNFKKGGITMCDVVERIRNDGRTEGRTEEQERIIMNLIESNAGTIEQIATWVKLPVKEVQKIARKVPVNA